MKNNKSFVGDYFDNKDLSALKQTITPSWTEKNLQYHLSLVDCPNVKTVCEVGCGIGRLLVELSDTGVGFCAGFDASKSMIKEGKKYVGDRNIGLFKCDGTGKLNIDNYFDFVFSIITFQHIPNTETVKKYISEAYRLLLDGGGIMFQVLKEDLNRGELWSYHPLDELEKHLGKLGFKNIQIETINKWAIFRAEK